MGKAFLISIKTKTGPLLLQTPIIQTGRLRAPTRQHLTRDPRNQRTYCGTTSARPSASEGNSSTGTSSASGATPFLTGIGHPLTPISNS